MSITELQKKRLSAQERYSRNTEAVQAYKAEKGCEECGGQYPHYILDTMPSVSRLAGARCSIDILMTALQSTKVVCANCRRAIQWKENHNKEPK